MTRAIPTILLLFLTAALLRAQDEKPAEVRRHDVRSLMSAFAETSVRFPFTTSPVRTGGAGESAIRSLWGQRGEEERQDDAIQAIVRFALRCDAEPDDCRERLFATDGWLQVSGPARFHEQVPRVLADLRRALATIEVELSVLPPEALATLSSAILDPAKADRLLEIAKPVSTMRTHVRPGSQTLLEAVARRAYVKDYNTEVAQDSKAVDPIVDVIPEGIRASIRVDPTPGGAYVVTIEGQAAELNGPMRTQVLTYSPSPAILQLPRTWWTSTSASARIESRGALVIGNDVAPRSAWMIRVLGPASPKPPDNPAVQLLPLRAVTRAALRTRAPGFHSPNPSGIETGAEGEQQEDGAPRLDAERLIERVRALSPDVAAEERRALHVASFLALDGNRAFLAAARDMVTKAVDDATHAVSLELRVGTVPAGFVVPAQEELEALAATLPQHAFGAAIPGDRVVLLGGESHAYLKDRDVEIAQGSSISKPLVDTFFTGFAASCEAMPAGDGRCAIDLRLEYQELVEMSTIATGSPEVPEIELPRIAAAVADMSTEIPLGSWALVHSSPLEGTDKHLVVLIRVTQS